MWASQYFSRSDILGFGVSGVPHAYSVLIWNMNNHARPFTPFAVKPEVCISYRSTVFISKAALLCNMTGISASVLAESLVLRCEEGSHTERCAFVKLMLGFQGTFFQSGNHEKVSKVTNIKFVSHKTLEFSTKLLSLMKSFKAPRSKAQPRLHRVFQASSCSTWIPEVQILGEIPTYKIFSFVFLKLSTTTTKKDKLKALKVKISSLDQLLCRQ